LVECIEPPGARITHLQLALHALDHYLPVCDDAEHKGACARCSAR
jgi:hypothetical protein